MLKELFEIFTETGYKWDFDLPIHPVVDRFKEQIKHIVASNPNYNDIDLTKFLIDFTVLIEDKVLSDEKSMQYLMHISNHILDVP